MSRIQDSWKEAAQLQVFIYFYFNMYQESSKERTGVNYKLIIDYTD